MVLLPRKLCTGFSVKLFWSIGLSKRHLPCQQYHPLCQLRHHLGHIYTLPQYCFRHPSRLDWQASPFTQIVRDLSIKLCRAGIMRILVQTSLWRYIYYIAYQFPSYPVTRLTGPLPVSVLSAPVTCWHRWPLHMEASNQRLAGGPEGHRHGSAKGLVRRV